MSQEESTSTSGGEDRTVNSDAAIPVQPSTGVVGIVVRKDVFENSAEDVKHQYELLSILDAKASALLTFNAIALASISIWLGYVPLNFLHLFLDMVFLVLLLSTGFLLPIIRLKWAQVQEDPEKLNGVRLSRTRTYRRAWILSTASVGLLVVISLVHTAGTALIATDLCGSSCQRFYSNEVFGNLDYEQSAG